MTDSQQEQRQEEEQQQQQEQDKHPPDCHFDYCYCLYCRGIKDHVTVHAGETDHETGKTKDTYVISEHCKNDSSKDKLDLYQHVAGFKTTDDHFVCVECHNVTEHTIDIPISSTECLMFPGAMCYKCDKQFHTRLIVTPDGKGSEKYYGQNPELQ